MSTESKLRREDKEILPTLPVCVDKLVSIEEDLVYKVSKCLDQDTDYVIYDFAFIKIEASTTDDYTYSGVCDAIEKILYE